jgi:hypothetical protein
MEQTVLVAPSLHESARPPRDLWIDWAAELLPTSVEELEAGWAWVTDHAVETIEFGVRHGWEFHGWDAGSPARLTRQIEEGNCLFEVFVGRYVHCYYTHPMEHDFRSFNPCRRETIERCFVSIRPPKPDWDMAELREVRRRRQRGDPATDVWSEADWIAFWRKGEWYLTDTLPAFRSEPHLVEGPFESGPEAGRVLRSDFPGPQRPFLYICPHPDAQITRSAATT